MASKVVFFAAALMAAMVAISGAQLSESEMRFRDRQCQREVQDSPLDACRQVLDRQLTGRERFQPMFRRPGALGLRMQCCQQLQDVSRECRCAAIRRMVRSYEESMPMPLEQGWSSSSSEYYGGEGSSSEQGYYGEGSSEEGYYGSSSSSRG